MSKSVPVQIVCRGCGGAYRTRARTAPDGSGGKTRCPGCGRQRRVSRYQEWEGPGAPSPAHGAVLARSPVGCRCRRCGHEWESRARDGVSIHCPRCRVSLRVPARGAVGATSGSLSGRRAVPPAPVRGAGGVSSARDDSWPVVSPPPVPASPGPRATRSTTLPGAVPAVGIPGFLGDVLRMMAPARPAPAGPPSSAAPSRPRPTAPPAPVAPRAPEGSPWVIGPRTGAVLARYGLPAPAVVPAGQCAGHTMLSGMPPAPCGGAATHVVSLGAGASFPVCPSHAHALIARHRATPDLPRPSLRPLRTGVGHGLPPEYLREDR